MQQLAKMKAEQQHNSLRPGANRPAHFCARTGILWQMKPDQPTSSDLCLACGLCCDGSLFERARLHPGEEELALSLSLTVLDAGSNNPGFRLPCPLFSDCCTIYNQQRPKICNAFRCKQLLRQDRGQPLHEGLAKISRARAMQAELAALLPKPGEDKPSLAEVKRQLRGLATPEVRRTHLNFVLLATQYEMFLRTHFLVDFHQKNVDKDLPIMD